MDISSHDRPAARIATARGKRIPPAAVPDSGMVPPGSTVTNVAAPIGEHLDADPAVPRRTVNACVVDAEPGPERAVRSPLHHRARIEALTNEEPCGDDALGLALEFETDGALDDAAERRARVAVSMLDHLAGTSAERHVTVLHADRSPAHHAHRLETEELVGRLPDATLHVWYETPQEPVMPHVHEGWADVARLTLQEGVSAFLCGPLPFMQAVRGDLLARGISPKDVHYEVFGPDLWLSK